MRDKVLTVFRRFIDVSICGCWNWKGRIHNNYGCCPFPGGSTQWAHRVSYALFNGNIKPQMHIDHTCRNPRCVNPAHLKQVTPQENYLAIHKRKKADRYKKLCELGQLKLW